MVFSVPLFFFRQSEFSDWFEIDETTRCSKRGQNLIRRKLGEVDRESDLFLDPQNPVLELTIVVSDTAGVHRVPKTVRNQLWWFLKISLH